MGDTFCSDTFCGPSQSLQSAEYQKTSSSNFSLEEPSLLDSSCPDDMNEPMAQLDGSVDFNGLTGVECESDTLSALLGRLT